MKTTAPSFPSLPGVYLFKDADGRIIYIGKALSLKNRIRSYFNPNNHDWKTAQLMRDQKTVEHIVTHNESAALILEATLIQDYQPKYNVLLKTGQPFLYFLFTDAELPQLELVRVKTRKGSYVGPFLHKTATRSAYNYLVQTLQLFVCNKTIENGCLDYHLGRCTGSCMPSWDKQEYLFRLKLAHTILTDKKNDCIAALQENIALHTQKQAFEKARNTYDYLQNILSIFDALDTRLRSIRLRRQISQVTAPLDPEKTAPASYAHDLQQLVGSDHPINSIDCFDISHFQSSYLVGSSVRFEHGKIIPDKCRNFNIKTLTQQNDYAALQEIVARRYRNKEDIPDLVLIDGGKGQLSAVRHIIPEATLAALAKREETLFTSGSPEGILLDVKQPHNRLLIALRDYVHHTAVSHHKKRRKKGFIPVV